MLASRPGTGPLPVTLFEALRAQARRTPHAWALLAPDCRPLTYAALLAQVQHTVAQLLVFGVGRGDRVAVVAGNGPEQATVVLSTAMGATCAPLNPHFTLAEFNYHLERLGARALIVHANEPAAAAARALDIPILTLVPTPQAPAGAFTLQGELRPLSGPGGAAQPEDVALLLHTSGSDARPKLVPLSQRHLLLSAHNYRPVLQLTPADRNLNLLPYHTIHGFNAGLLASLAVGASVVCTPGLVPGEVLRWLREFQPTWFSASPALLADLLDAATAEPALLPVASLRFVRSGGAALPLALGRALEACFGVPVIEGYGMTEANPIACNPLPPRPRKPGSVGPSAGPEIGIMAPDGSTLLPVGQVGEVVVRGTSVIAAYAGDAIANVQNFVQDWLRTGDLGYLDADGYLFLTGRLKEQINAGGEKVAPAEVEAVLLAHPAVARAAAFALPDPRLGEAVGAAVVVHPGQAPPDEPALRRFAAERLAGFKVPRRIAVVEALPLEASGKVARAGLAERLGLALEAPSASMTDSA